MFASRQGHVEIVKTLMLHNSKASTRNMVCTLHVSHLFCEDMLTSVVQHRRVLQLLILHLLVNNLMCALCYKNTHRRILLKRLDIKLEVYNCG